MSKSMTNQSGYYHILLFEDFQQYLGTEWQALIGAGVLFGFSVLGVSLFSVCQVLKSFLPRYIYRDNTSSFLGLSVAVQFTRRTESRLVSSERLCTFERVSMGF